MHPWDRSFFHRFYYCEVQEIRLLFIETNFGANETPVIILRTVLYNVRMAERSKALRSGRSPLLWAWVRIPLLTITFFI